MGQDLAVAAGDWGGCIAAIAKTRDREAFAALFRHFAPRVKSYLLRCHMDAGVAEELAQETMLTVWRKAEHIRPGAGLGLDLDFHHRP